MTVGVTTQRMPSASTSAGQVGVGLVDHEGAGERGVEAGDADDAGLVAQLDEQAVGRALERGAGDDRRHGDDVVAAGGHGVAHAGHGEHRADRHDRVRRGDHDDVGAGDGVEHARARAGRRRRPSKRTADDRHVVVALHEVLLEADLDGRRRAVVGDGDHGAQRGRR